MSSGDLDFSHASLAINALLQRLSGSGQSLQSVIDKLIVQSSLGHVCLPAELMDVDELALVANHPMVGNGLAATPLVADKDAVYSYRYWRDEHDVANELIQRAADNQNIDMEKAAVVLQALFPATADMPVDWQKMAAAMALLNTFSVITGGPGTGKTTTVVRLLMALQSLSNQPLRIALTAPTGKATARLQESVDNVLASEENAVGLNFSSQTVHRLLGVGYIASKAKYHRHKPLALDVLVVDEASMLDLTLFKKLLDALSDSTRLILLGDKYQLASVDAGSVLADICAGRLNAYSSARAGLLQQLTQCEVNITNNTASCLSNNIVQLEHSYRFAAGGGIGCLATAVQNNDMESLRQLIDAPDDQLEFISEAKLVQLIKQACQKYRDYLLAVQANASVADIFKQFEQFRVLVAMRKGTFGVQQINQSIQTALMQQGLIHAESDFYPGRPVLILRNSYQQQLYNGDIGLLLPDDDGQLMATFMIGDTISRKVPEMLPQHETVYAMTIHKSQGSEFSSVALLLPEKASPILSRELLYTGITRAKNELSLYASTGIIKQACSTATQRYSRLQQRLLNDD